MRENAVPEPSERLRGAPLRPPARVRPRGLRHPRGEDHAATLRRRRALALSAAAGIAGALALGVSDFTTLYRVSAGTVSRTVIGHDQHAYALALVGAAALVLLTLAGRGSEPAALGVTALGVVALIVGPISDRHSVTSTGVIGHLYENATAQSGLGYHLELAGSVVLLLAGGALLATAPPGLLQRLSEPFRRRRH